MSRDHLRRLSSRGSCTTGKDDTARRFLSEVTCGENPRYRRRCPASCNDGAAKHAISDFVERVTREGVPNFVPCRPASWTFDNAGSLWAEKPVPLQVLNAFDRVSCWHQSIRTDTPNSLYRRSPTAIWLVSAQPGRRAPREEDDCDHTAMTTEEFSQSIKEARSRFPQPRSIRFRPGPGLQGRRWCLSR